MAHGLMRTRVMESRAYDSHYDPVFTWSGDRPRQGVTHTTHTRTQARRRNDRVMRTEWFAPCAACAHRASIHSLFLPSALSLSLQGIPAWSNSVSQVNQAPRANYRAAPRTSINAQFRGTSLAQTIPAIMPDGTIGRIAAPAASSSVPRVVGINGPMSAAQVQHQLTSEVLGRSRVKFFKRPVIPFLSADGAAPTAEQQAAIDAAYAANLADQQAAADAAVEEAHRTFGTQTDYRESETQTDPYTPDYITSPEEPEPEILGLAHLTYGAGLPASMAELNLIQRMREKKAFEASLPPITDAASFELRKQMLEERELAEWALREEEMKQEQEDRLQILVDTLKLREAKVEELNEQRIDAIRQARVRVRDEAFDAIHRDRIKMHRALGKNRVELDASTAHMSGGYKELTSSHTSNRRNGLRDIVGDYADHSSQVYAPVQRQGKLPVKNQVVDYGIPLISNFQGLSDLERHLPSSATSLTVTQPQIRVASLATRKGQAIRADLDYVDSLLEAQRADGLPVGITGDAKAHYGRKKGLIENVYKKFEPVQRAPTPTVQIPDEEEASRAVLLLQRLLRGRMVQNAMYEGKQHHRALIAELRVAENPPEEVETDEDEPLHHALDTLQGELASTALDFVSKEVVRTGEENRIAALVHHAALTRRHRESEESGRRQAEAVLRQKRERQMREVMRENSKTADRYLDELIDRSILAYAESESSHLAAVNAQSVEPITASIEVSSTAAVEDASDASENILGDLVASFILPEVERRRSERKAELQDRRFVQQAHEAVFQAIAGMQSGKGQ